MTIKLKDEEILISLFVILERARRLYKHLFSLICGDLQKSSDEFPPDIKGY